MGTRRACECAGRWSSARRYAARRSSGPPPATRSAAPVHPQGQRSQRFAAAESAKGSSGGADLPGGAGLVGDAVRGDVAHRGGGRAGVAAVALPRHAVQQILRRDLDPRRWRFAGARRALHQHVEAVADDGGRGDRPARGAAAVDGQVVVPHLRQRRRQRVSEQQRRLPRQQGGGWGGELGKRGSRPADR